MRRCSLKVEMGQRRENGGTNHEGLRSDKQFGKLKQNRHFAPYFDLKLAELDSHEYQERCMKKRKNSAEFVNR